MNPGSENLERVVIDIKQSRSLVGEFVEIRVDREESGYQGRLNRIVGTLKRTVRDPEGGIYWIVEAEAAPPTETEANGRCQSMSHFMVTPKAVGSTLEAAFESHDDELAVAIGYVIDQSILDSGSFEFSQTRFFAIGYLGFIRDRF